MIKLLLKTKSEVSCKLFLYLEMPLEFSSSAAGAIRVWLSSNQGGFDKLSLARAPT